MRSDGGADPTEDFCFKKQKLFTASLPRLSVIPAMSFIRILKKKKKSDGLCKQRDALFLCFLHSWSGLCKIIVMSRIRWSTERLLLLCCRSVLPCWSRDSDGRTERWKDEERTFLCDWVHWYILADVQGPSFPVFPSSVTEILTFVPPDKLHFAFSLS